MKFFTLFVALVDFGLAALNAAVAACSLSRGNLAGAVNIFAAIFCFGCGLYVCIKGR